MLHYTIVVWHMHIYYILFEHMVAISLVRHLKARSEELNLLPL